MASVGEKRVRYWRQLKISSFVSTTKTFQPRFGPPLRCGGVKKEYCGTAMNEYYVDLQPWKRRGGMKDQETEREISKRDSQVERERERGERQRTEPFLNHADEVAVWRELQTGKRSIGVVPLLHERRLRCRHASATDYTHSGGDEKLMAA
jgi:hypothetical protein